MDDAVSSWSSIRASKIKLNDKKYLEVSKIYYEDLYIYV